MHPSWNELFIKYKFNLSQLYENNVYPPENLVFKVFEMDVKEN